MSGKSRVRKLMKKFDRNCRDTEDDPPPSQPFKIPKSEVPEGLHQARKVALERLTNPENEMDTSGPSTSHKTDDAKAPLAVKPSDDKREHDLKPSYLNSVAQIFGVLLQATNREKYEKPECSKFPIKTCDPAKEDPKPLHPKPAWNKFPRSALAGKEEHPLGARPKSDLAPQKSKAKPAFPKVPEIKEKLKSIAQENASKSSLFEKPSNIKVLQNKNTSNKCDSLQSRLSGPRTNTHSIKTVKEMGENNSAAEAAGSCLPKIALKPAGHSQSIFQGAFKNTKMQTEEKRMSITKTTVAKKVVQEGLGSTHTFCNTDRAFDAGSSSNKSEQKEDRNGSSRCPKKRVLAPVFELPMLPVKPKRPLHVKLQGYQKDIPKKTSENKGRKLTALSSELAPTRCGIQFPSPALTSNLAPELTEAPSLPPRNIKPRSETKNPENEENYDDVEFVSQGDGSTQGDQDGDVEIYEDISDIRSSRKEEKKQIKDKKRMEQEKKEQKEKEKKELELRKKFQLVGTIQVVHEFQACADHKGGKDELAFKQGDKIEIVRLTDNPEGKWLGRTRGCYGYVKTNMVGIYFDSLERKQQAPVGANAKFPESYLGVYDDVEEQERFMSLDSDNSGAGNVLSPPPPLAQEIYDEIGDGDPVARSVSQDEDKNGIWSWGILKRLKVKDNKKKSIREKTTKVNGTSSSAQLLGRDYGENVYDDMDSSGFPPLPPEATSLKPESFGKHKLDEKDEQKHEMMEREEKKLQKKFKFVGEIEVLFPSTVVQNLPKERLESEESHDEPGEFLMLQRVRMAPRSCAVTKKENQWRNL